MQACLPGRLGRGHHPPPALLLCGLARLRQGRTHLYASWTYYNRVALHQVFFCGSPWKPRQADSGAYTLGFGIEVCFALGFLCSKPLVIADHCCRGWSTTAVLTLTLTGLYLAGVLFPKTPADVEQGACIWFHGHVILILDLPEAFFKVHFGACLKKEAPAL